jgi:hypothetical protein
MALLVGAGIALAWTGAAHPGLGLTGHPFPDGSPDADETARKLLLSVLAVLAVCGLFGVVAWLADLQSAQMSRSGRRRFKRGLGQRADHGVG